MYFSFERHYDYYSVIFFFKDIPRCILLKTYPDVMFILIGRNTVVFFLKTYHGVNFILKANAM